MQQKKIEIKVPLYGLEALHKACYRFLDRAYIRLEGDPAGSVTVLFRSKENADEKMLDTIAGEFENELIHQALRVRVTGTNQKIREYIVTRALAAAEGVALSQQPPAPQAAPVLDEDLEKEIEKLLAEVEKEGGEDPLKITVPWEQKHPQPVSAEEPGGAPSEK